MRWTHDEDGSGRPASELEATRGLIDDPQEVARAPAVERDDEGDGEEGESAGGG